MTGVLIRSEEAQTETGKPSREDRHRNWGAAGQEQQGLSADGQKLQGARKDFRRSEAQLTPWCQASRLQISETIGASSKAPSLW